MILDCADDKAPSVIKVEYTERQASCLAMQVIIWYNEI
jgi:hypothetical protein